MYAVALGRPFGAFECVGDEVGSESTFHDGLEFDGRDLMLRSFSLGVPDQPLNSDLARSWLEAPVVDARLRLCERCNFGLDTAHGRIFAGDGSLLMGLYAEIDGPHRSRVQVAEDLEFLFADDGYVGWLLHRPIAHVRSPDLRDQMEWRAVPDAAAAVASFVEYYSLLDESFLDRLTDEDPGLRGSLLSLAERLRDAPRGSARRALRRQVGLILRSSFSDASVDDELDGGGLL
jgi:hypothetical protein